MKADVKRQTRIDTLYDKALNGKFTKDGFFRVDLIEEAAMLMSVTKATARTYADVVVDRLVKGGHLKR